MKIRAAWSTATWQLGMFGATFAEALSCLKPKHWRTVFKIMLTTHESMPEDAGRH